MKKIKNPLRWFLLITFVIFGLLYLNGAASSWWLSWGPPTDYPEAWEQQAIKRLSISLILLFTGPMIFVALKDEFSYKKSRYIYIWVVIILASVSYPKSREWLLIDTCLDSGGKWEHKYFKCTLE